MRICWPKDGSRIAHSSDVCPTHQVLPLSERNVLSGRSSCHVWGEESGRSTCLAPTLRPPAFQVAMPHLSRDQRLILLGLRPEGGEQKAQGMPWYGESDLPVCRVARKVTDAQKRGHEIGRGTISQPGHCLELGAAKFSLRDEEVVQRDERLP